MNRVQPNRNESELLFEEYLSSHGYSEWTHEEPTQGKQKKPDYRLKVGGSSLLLEVKEFEAPQPPRSFGTYDPYGPIRQKINQAARQFKEYKEFPCSVVLSNPKSAFVQLGEPWAIIGAMLGNLGFQFKFRSMPDEAHPLQQVFTSGGKMVNDKRQQPQNTTVSAIVVLGAYPLRMKQIRVAIKNREAELGRATTLAEGMSFYDAIPETPELGRVRVVVYENPFARIPLGRDLFCGPFDERWGSHDEHIQRIYVGHEVAQIEAALGEV
jgi:hypothetical protein